jgi:hypothetical protein
MNHELCIVGYLHRAVRWKSCDISEEEVASIFMVEKKANIKLELNR